MKRNVLLGVVAFLAASAFGADCPRFRGPAGDGCFPETGLLRQWPQGGPAPAWSAKGLGPGYSSAVVVGGTVYVTGMDGQDQGILFAFDADGKEKYRISYGPEFVRSGPAPTGTRGTAAIDGDRAYVINGFGVLVMIDLAAKEVVRTVDLVMQFNGAKAQFGFAECALVAGDKVVCTPGGPDASLVALDKKTSRTVWKTQGLSEPSNYCSARLIMHGGKEMILTAVGKSTVGVDSATGKVLWVYDNLSGDGRMSPTQANPPLYADGMVFACAGMRAGGTMIELTEDASGATPKWTDKTLDCQIHGTVLVDGCIYGTAQSGNAGLVCLEWKTGKVMWQAGLVKQAAVVTADGMLYLYGQDGVVRLVKPNPAAFEPVGEFTVTEGTDQHWAHPTIANGRLYIRHGDALMAYDVKPG